MIKRSATHASFTLRRLYPVPPARAFAAFASAEGKSQWFGAPDDGSAPNHCDFPSAEAKAAKARAGGTG